jgi:hypothetical protein
LVDYDDICIIGVTNENLVKDFLQRALKERRQPDIDKGFWKMLVVIFPTRDTLERIRDQINDKVTPNYLNQSATDAAALDVRIANWQNGRRAIMNFILREGNSSNLSECLEYRGLIPFIGQRFRSGSSQDTLDTSVRISPVLPGADVKKNFYIEVFEQQETFPPLNEAFETIVTHSRPILEWNVHGLPYMSEENANGFSVCGIARDRRRSDLVASPNQHCLVVLILLHVLTRSDHHIVLQERSRWNASTDFNCLSNISGWVTDQDLFAGIGVKLAPEYVNNNYKASADSIPTDAVASDNLLRSLNGNGDHQPYNLSETQLDTVARFAASREIKEEIGLEKTPIALGRSLILPQEQGKRPSLLFRLFQLGLTDQEMETVSRIRPHASLVQYSLNDLDHIFNSREKNFNRLLQRKYESDFREIYAGLLS